MYSFYRNWRSLYFFIAWKTLVVVLCALIMCVCACECLHVYVCVFLYFNMESASFSVVDVKAGSLVNLHKRKLKVYMFCISCKVASISSCSSLFLPRSFNKSSACIGIYRVCLSKQFIGMHKTT